MVMLISYKLIGPRIILAVTILPFGHRGKILLL